MIRQKTTTSHTWDSRSWTVALVAGNVCGFAAFLCTYGPTAYVINSKMFHMMVRLHLHYYASQMITVCCGVLCFFILPMTLSGIARRNTFLWGLLPMAVFLMWREASDIAQKHYDPTALWAIPLSMLLASLVAAGPIALGRWLVRRRRERLLTIPVSEDRNAAGVWPPPPTRSE